MKSNFFESNTYFVDEKVNFFRFENLYQIYDGNGENIGVIKQKLSVVQKLLRLLLNKNMLPFLLEIRNTNDEVEATISRGWTFFMSKIVIADANGETTGIIKQKFKFFTPTFKIYNASEDLLAEISGDWKAWNFNIVDEFGAQIGTITKKWAGAMKEIFTTADKYNVNIEESYKNQENKKAILSAAITIDMVLKESK